jgi:uracil-DNA glycosylase family 4
MGEHCQGCPYREVSGAISGSGDPSSPVVIVGEAPGANELRLGVPFVGAAGQLLDKLLDRSGIRRTDCYITNAMLCRPTESPPDRRGIDACRTRLGNELKSHPRSLVLTFGATALKSITGNHNIKITHERGRVIETPYGRVLPTIHPAAVLRGYSDFPKLLKDVQYAASLLGGGGVRSAGQTKHTLVREDTLDKAVGFLLRKRLLAADIETSGYDPLVDRVLSLAVCWEENKVAIFPDTLLKTPQVKRLLESQGPRWVWHNGKFDTAFLRSNGLDARVDEDTMLMHYALDESRGTHDLKQLAGDLLGAPDYKQELRKYLHRVSDSFENIPRPVLYKYQARDADCTFQIYGILRKQLEQVPDLVGLYTDLLIPAGEFLQRVERRGMYVNREYLDDLEQRLTAKLQADKEAILEEVKDFWDADMYVRQTGAKSIPAEFNPGSPLQLRWVLGRNLRRQIADTREDTLIRLPQTRLVRAILEYRETGKALSTYVVGIRERIGRDGRVRSTYLLHGTSTGRLSSRGPNMQNIPRDKTIRNVFQAPPGRVLVEMDYSQIELRVLAYLSGDRFLRDVYMRGRDLHDEVAAALFGPGFTKEQRIRAKFVNFGIAYGRGAGSIAHEFGIDFPEAQRMIKEWFRRAPEARDFINECRRAPNLGKPMSTLFGRRRRFSLVTRENLNALQNEAVNFPMQSTASDITLTFAMRYDSALRANWHAGIVNLIHDSVLIEVPKTEDIAGMIAETRKVMCQHPQELLGTDLPFEVSVSRGTLWGDISSG